MWVGWVEYVWKQLGMGCLGTILKDYMLLKFFVTDMEPGKLSCLWESLFAQFANLLLVVV